MLTRRDFLQVAAATALAGTVPLGRAAAGQAITQDSLLAFQPVGQVTLLAVTDLHAQLMPLWYREPVVNLGAGADLGLPPHLPARAMMAAFGLKPGSLEAYAFTADDFIHLARTYGRVGGLDRMATLIKAIRAERPGRTLLIDSGDTWQGSYTALKTQGADMVEAQTLLGVEAMTAHWEFTYGEARVKELVAKLPFPFLAANIRDTEWEEAVFPAQTMVERGGVKIAVIGQAFPYTPVANPRWQMPHWSFGIREEEMQAQVDQARARGADLVVVASHNGFDVDRKMAARVTGIDVMLTGHTHDAIPAVVAVGATLLVAPGSHGKFLARLDLEVKDKRIVRHGFRLIPVLADAIAPDPDMAALIGRIRAPHAAELSRVVGHTRGLLSRRGNFNGTFDDLICQAMLAERDAEIALSPGFRWGAALAPGEAITTEAIFNQTAITYPNTYRTEMTGAMLKDILEDVADNLFHPDPYYRQGGDMVRLGGLAFAIDPAKPMGSRIGDLRLTRTGKALDAGRSYVVSGWASVNEATQGPPIWEVVSNHVARVKEVNLPDSHTVRVVAT